MDGVILRLSNLAENYAANGHEVYLCIVNYENIM